MVFDGHSDLLYDVTRRRLAGEKHVLERRHLRNLEAGGMEGLVLALWVSADTFWKDVPEATDDWARTEIMLVGTFGYVIGTYLGILVGGILLA